MTAQSYLCSLLIKKGFHVIGAFFLSALLFFAQTTTVQAAQSVIVTVGNPDGGNIIGAYVSAAASYGSGGCTTNSLGYCSISLPTPATYTVGASAGGYIPQSVSRYIGAGQNVSFRIVLPYNKINPPQLSTPTPYPTTSVNVCVYRNGSLVSGGTVQISWGAQVPLNGGCRIYYVNKYQTVGFTAYHGGQSKYGTVYVGAVPTGIRIDMPATTVPPKISSSPTAPKRVEGSILTENNLPYKGSVTVYLKNTSSGQTGNQQTTSGSYAFTGLAGGTQSYEVYATLPSGTRIPGGKSFSLTSGTMTVTFKLATGNPGITITKPVAAPKRVEGSILSANNMIYRNTVTVTLKNTSTGQVGRQTTETGSYAFTGLAGGTQSYEVSAVTSSGQRLSGTQSFSLTSGTKTVNFTFPSGNPGITITKPPTIPTETPKTHTLTGTVDIQRGSSTEPYRNATITVKNSAGQTRSTQTNTVGRYTFDGLNAMSYEVSLTLPSGTRAVNAATQNIRYGYVINSHQYTSGHTVNFKIAETTTNPGITVTKPTIAPSSVPIDKTGTIQGTVTMKSADGTSKPYRNATVTVTNNSNQSRSTTTSSIGGYSFTGLNALEYVVSITPPEFAEFVTPVSGSTRVRLDTTKVRTVDFSMLDVRTTQLTPTGNQTQPTIAPTKVNVTVRTQTVNGIALPGVQVCVDPDGRGCYTTDAKGEITAVVDKNVLLTISATRTGLTTHRRTYTATKDVILITVMESNAPTPPVQPSQPPTTPIGSKSISGNITVDGQSGVYAGEVKLTLLNTRTLGTSTRTTTTGSYIFDNLNNAASETYEISAELMNADQSYGITAPVRVTVDAGQHGTANFKVNRRAVTNPSDQNASLGEITQGGKIADLSVLLHGIGTAGDNRSQGHGNKRPLKTTRPVEISFHDSSNKFVQKANAEVTFSEETGNFIGQITLPSTLQSGTYTTKVAIPGYLTKQVPEIILNADSETFEFPSVTLVTGDINNDDQLSILDYALIIDCYSDRNPPKNCTDEEKGKADLNDDGDVNQFDYNLFLRELSIQYVN